MFRLPERQQQNKQFVECAGPGPHVTKNGSRWLVVGFHKFIQIEDGTFRCQKCVEAGRPKLEPLPAYVQRHEVDGRAWGIKRTRQRTDERPGSDMWTCTYCGRRGDFWFFNYFQCPKNNEQTQVNTREFEEGVQVLDDF